jgi:acyl transferase domain-containing protein/NAD(P)-dependent dehydrogenase (short-subunit alcohol dehydrogenase family)
VAIIGMGCLFPRADGLSQYWSLIRNGVDAITDVPASHWSVADYFDRDPKAPDRTYARRGGFLAPVDFPALEFGIAPQAIEATDSTQLLGLLVARQALEDAGYGPGRSLDRDRVSVILGVTGTLELVIPLGARLGHPIWRRALAAAGVDAATSDEVVGRIAASYPPWQENSFPGLLGNVVAGRIANRLDLRGTNCVVDAACASSLGAVHLALLELAAGRCDLAVTGGLDTFNDIFMFMCFSKTPALSPSGEARPFDAEADGTILGEGLGVLVLKRLADARRDGDRVYAVIRSMGTSSDGKGQAVYAPSVAGQVAALRRAYASAGLSPRTVELVEAHGTGTKIGDAAELAALEQVYRGAGPEGSWCALGSVKSQVGHTKAAAGAAGLIKVALALHHKVLPPTMKVRRPLERLARGDSPFYLNTEVRPWLSAPGEAGPRRAAVSAFGFGGSNFHCVLEEAELRKSSIDWDGEVQILAFSADQPGDLSPALSALEGPPSWSEIRAVAARSRARFCSSHHHRLVLVARRGCGDWDELLAAARSRLQGRPHESGSAPAASAAPEGAPRVFLGTGPRPGLLAMLFPGQGAQYLGMLRELACRFPRMQETLSRMNDAAGDQAGRCSDRIYPPPAFDETVRAAAELALRDTRIAQPAIGAVSLGLLRILDDFGVRAELVGGHSFGELTALCAAGRIDDAALAMLAQRRGALMARCAARGAGAMLAVFAAPDEVAAMAREHSLDLVVANKNAPRQCVLSGAAGEVERFRRLLQDRRITTSPIPVSAAFHSRFVASAAEPFRRTLEAVALGVARIPVFANATASPYPDDPGSARELLASQLLRPVEFVAQIDAMYRSGARTFLEVGPDAKLTGLVRSILEGRECLAMAVDASRGIAGNLYDLACSLATLAALGYAVDLTRWDEADRTQPVLATKPGLTVRICGSNARPKDTPPNQSPRGPTCRDPDRERTRQDFLQPNPPHEPTLAHYQPRDPAENHRTMNPPDWSHSKHTNGQVPRPAPDPSQAAGGSEPQPPGPSVMPAVPVPAGLSSALQSVQDNLVALQRLAEQTADLHRQFLTGQEKAQQAFLELLEHQRLLSLSVLESAGSPALPSAQPQRTGERHGVPPRGRGSAPAGRAGMPVRGVLDEPRRERLAPLGADDGQELRPSRIEMDPKSSPGPLRAGQAEVLACPITADAVTAALIDVVAAKTGYPAEVLELDMHLYADLGIDSIKRVEILAALQERHPELAPPSPEQLGSFKTLRAIAEFIGRAPTDLPPPALPAIADRPAAVAVGDLARELLETTAEKTGYPAEMLELDMRLDADLGIDSIKRVEILAAFQDRFPGLPAMPPDRVGSLMTLRDIVALLHDASARVQASDVAPEAPLPAHSRTSGTAVPGDWTRILLEAVAERTGYPPEMLELDMRLDADLGIDSIKRVEILSAVQDRLPETRAIGPEHAGTLQTLRQIVEFLSAGPRAAPTAESGPVPAPPDVHRNGTAFSARYHYGADVGSRDEHRHVSGPSVILRRWQPRAVPMAARDRRATVSLPAGGTIWMTDDGSPLAEAVRVELIDRGYRPRVIRSGEVPGPAPEEDLCGVIILAPRGRGEGFLFQGLGLLRFAGPALERSGLCGGAALLTVARLDGEFAVRGLDPQIDPASGALAGLAKTAGQEWPRVHCKAVDLDEGAFESPRQAALSIVDELLARGPAEVGLSRRGRIMLELEAAPDPGPAGAEAHHQQRGGLVVISGGARGIMAEVALALAESFQPALLLLGRSPEPGPEAPWLAACHDEAELKRALLARLDTPRTPREIGEHARRIMGQREIRFNLNRIGAAGSTVVYRSVDVREQAAVRSAIARAVHEFGPVRGLLHGAGVLADRRITAQTDEQFERVYDTKVTGLHNVFRAIDPESLQFLVLFSSSTARFGRTGQVAYAAANEYLNKWAQQAALRLPHCRVVSFNWGPWAGGMVTDSLRPLFEREGLTLIPPEAGARLVIDEIESLGPGARPVELVVLAEPQGSVSSPSASDVTPTPEPGASRKPERVFRRAVSLKTLPILNDHVIDGHAVLPMALIIEWAAEGALHRHPGLVFCGLDNLRLFKGVTLTDRDAVTVDLMAGKAVRSGTDFVVPIELRGTLANGRDVVHARADVILAEWHTSGTRRLDDRRLPDYSLRRDEVYGGILFHGPALQGIEHVEGCGPRAIAARVATAPPPSAWVERPLRGRWLTDPLAIDCSFQLIVLWSREQLGADSLPTAVGRYRQFRAGLGDGTLRVLAEIRQATDARAVADIELVDQRGELVAQIDSYECIVDPSLSEAFRRNQLIAPSSVVLS